MEEETIELTPELYKAAEAFDGLFDKEEFPGQWADWIADCYGDRKPEKRERWRKIAEYLKCKEFLNNLTVTIRVWPEEPPRS